MQLKVQHESILLQTSPTIHIGQADHLNKKHFVVASSRVICPGDNFLLSQLKIAKTFIVTKAEICCTLSGNWSEAAGDNTTTAYLFLFHKQLML